ncbi:MULTISPECIES: GNAT family N-acetyltransferase [Bacillaceae]|uniref:GNAT family N-acetyltransferase n=1 Tax=Evansella alkalicola TaxID=745819 RepID=A0ABS6K214_9BACI|nr:MULTISPECIES: GNAT family N-acetyltransferase [Bacillaceae]MBU9723525.1 GNAT family N-acetyltransferase [Bacillus alkalicola]
MIIREANQNEIHAIREQRIEAYLEHRREIPNDHWEGLKAAISSEADMQSGVDLIVAEDDETGELLGSVVLFPPKSDAYEGYVEELDYPEIRMLAVGPNARGKGVGKALIRECIQRSKARGYQYIGLHTGEFMKNAIALYEQFGFKRVPKYDFEPADDGIIVKAFKLEI